MKLRELPVSFYEISVKAAFHGLPEAEPVPPPVMELFQKCRDADRTPKTDGSVRLSIEDWRKSSNGQHAVLINRADQNRTDVAMVHYPTGRRRQAGKTAEDGLEYSTHVLISPIPKNDSRAMVLATGGAGVSRDQLQRIFNQLLSAVRADDAHAEYFNRAHPSAEAGKVVKLKCHFELLAHQSRLFTDILNLGCLNEVELIQNEHMKLDRHFTQKAHTVRLMVAEEGSPLTLAMLKRAIGVSGVTPNQLLIKFRDPDLGGLATKTLEANDLEGALTKRDVIKFDTDISPCYTSLNMGIIQKLRDLLGPTARA